MSVAIVPVAEPESVIPGVDIYHGDSMRVLREIPSDMFQCVVTSPPYWMLRDYGVDGQMGHEKTPDEYIEKLVAVMMEIKRVLRPDGVCFLNLGDSYLRSTKSLAGIPWRVAIAMNQKGWCLRADIVWDRPNVMPESVRDRPTRSHEYVFMLTKTNRYFYNADAIREKPAASTVKRIELMDKRSAPVDAGSTYKAGEGRMASRGQHVDHLVARPHALGRNRRSVWRIASALFKGSHFAVFPEQLVRICLLAGSRPGDRVLDPFSGAGTTLLVAKKLGRPATGIELNDKYCQLARERIRTECKQLTIGEVYEERERRKNTTT